MPPLQQLQWKGPPVPRAKPISQEIWGQHREELCRLYLNMTLDDLMAMMRVRHGFAPSRRQYISQFEKWGIQKYKNLINEASSPDCVPGPSRSPNTSASQGSHEGNPLRITPIQMHGLIPQHNLSEKPEVPPKKRQKLSEFIASKDPYSELGLAFDTPATSHSVSQSLTPSRQEASSIGCMPFGGVNASPKVFCYTPDLLKNQGGRTLSIEAGNVGMLLPSVQPSNDWDRGDSERWADDTFASNKLSKGKKRLDSSRSDYASTLAEIQDMKRAADFLSSLSFDEDAFVLYLLVLRQLTDSSKQPAWVMYSAILACVRSAETPSQVQISQNLLEQKLSDQDGSIPAVENFLFRMLLAATYVRSSDYEMAKFDTQLALEFVAVHETLLMYLPQDNRTLDIITYHCLTHDLVQHYNFTGDSPFEFIRPHNLHINKGQLQDQLLQQKPGPFELNRGRMGNPCMRSCLEWCTAELEYTDTITSSWKCTPAGDKSLQWVEGVEIYCCLWERWQNHQNLELKLWTSRTEELMGIPASELLKTICSMISMKSPPPSHNPHWDLVFRSRIGLETLSGLSDEEFARQFLDAYSWRNTLIPSSSEQEEYREGVRSCARDLIEKSLKIKIPDVQDSRHKSGIDELSDTPQRLEIPDMPLQPTISGQSFNLVAAALLPTLAPSLHSSDFSSLRMLRDRIQQNFGSAMQIAADTLPSSLFRRSDLSLLTMSELSQRMASSLSLASLTALDALAAVSTNVMDRVAEWESRPRQSREFLLHADEKATGSLMNEEEILEIL